MTQGLENVSNNTVDSSESIYVWLDMATHLKSHTSNKMGTLLTKACKLSNGASPQVFHVSPYTYMYRHLMTPLKLSAYTHITQPISWTHCESACMWASARWEDHNIKVALGLASKSINYQWLQVSVCFICFLIVHRQVWNTSLCLHSRSNIVLHLLFLIVLNL